jgi:hypothetical protein
MTKAATAASRATGSTNAQRKPAMYSDSASIS